MSIFCRIMDALIPRRINDSVFGSLQFRRIARWKGWKGRGRIPGLTHEIGLSIEAGRDGVTDLHRQFFQELARNWRSLFESWIPLIVAQTKEWEGGPLSLETVRLFRLDQVDFPTMESPPFWNLVFWSEREGYPIVVSFLDWTPIDVCPDVNYPNSV
jgi:hypothetical protein